MENPIFSRKTDEEQIEIVRKFNGKPIPPKAAEKGVPIKGITENVSYAGATLPPPPRRLVSPATYDALCLSEEINLIAKTVLIHDISNQVVPLYRTGGENWIRVRMCREEIEENSRSPAVSKAHTESVESIAPDNSSNDSNHSDKNEPGATHNEIPAIEPGAGSNLLQIPGVDKPGSTASSAQTSSMSSQLSDAPSKMVPADQAQYVVKYQAANCAEVAKLAFALITNSGIDRPVFLLYDQKDDHTYVVIGDPDKDPPEEVVIVDPYMSLAIAHTLADSTAHFPTRAGVVKKAEYRPGPGVTPDAFSLPQACAQPIISQQQVLAYVESRNKERAEFGMPALPTTFGDAFVDVLTEDGTNMQDLFDYRTGIKNVETIYYDGHGRSRSFNCLPEPYLTNYLKTFH